MKIRKDRISTTLSLWLGTSIFWYFFWYSKDKIVLVFCILVTLGALLMLGNLFYIVNLKDDPEYKRKVKR